MLSSPVIAVHPASAADFSVIIALARRIWPLAYAGVLTPQQIDNMLEKIYNPDNLAQEMADGHRFWLAALGGEPVAYASAFKKKGVLWIKKLYVDPARQGQGIGKALIAAAIQAFRPASEMRLLANPNNAAAHQFYLRQGFAKIGEVPVRMGDWDFLDFLFSKQLQSC